MKNNSLILALDVGDLKTAKKFVQNLKDYIDIFKIGSILFTREGPAVIRMIKRLRKKVFLDLKYHDIPNTVGMAVKSARELGIDMLTIHTSGGFEMMQEAVRNKGKMFLFGVTVLTSIDKKILKFQLGVDRDVKKQVVMLAKMAKMAGLDGVVASGNEIEQIRRACGRNFLILVPGVRPLCEAHGDQKRVVAPSDALRRGANFIVVGRPILKASDPVKITESIIKEMRQR
ncbi:orotidine 5'-phosphate decarboxylase [Candidatus Desantisbacteria bacterium CG1_02_38_46]|uniref:Orotidine 5'-phosphate decarboxylase n=2 Tax=unclassified Candidatus Desantisiibacteriota TaxID=3106372 RepID=A0A1J4SCG2_9BACT|nr:MAG: orotidine 5'-phosphate decarboxylase [Candidatus Desantisbacteria bacterium CG1_02_38_46]PIU51264.1 MAG: orotidine-5'-phosphate decarboxylase [Candidatus Desantisbacteria bacterium CG07_land_8_20_14_0_80_39_15]